MSVELNQEHVNDTAKLMIHRLIARAISRDPSLVEKAKVSLDQSSQRFGGYQTFNEARQRPSSALKLVQEPIRIEPVEVERMASLIR
jgi:hypothetical protein